MENNLETILKIKEFFKTLDIKGNNINECLKNLQTRRAFLERHYKHYTYKKPESKSLSNNRYYLSTSQKDKVPFIAEIIGEGVDEVEGHVIYLKKDRLEWFFKNFDVFEKFYSREWITKSRDWNIEEIKIGAKYNIWDWDIMSKHPKNFWRTDNYGWGFEYIEEFKDFLHGKYVQLSENTYWTEEFIDKYTEHFFSVGKSYYGRVKWTDYLLEKYTDKWDWHEVSMCVKMEWTDELIDKYADRLDWDIVSYQDYIYLSERTIDKYADRLDFKRISKRLNKYYGNSKEEANFELTPYLQKKYIDRWNFDEIISHKYAKLDVSVIEKFKDTLNWKNLIENECVYWTEKIIDDYADYFFPAFGSGGYNSSRKFCKNTEWTYSLIYKYKDKWNFEHIFENTNVFWSEELLDKFQQSDMGKSFWENFYQYGNTDWCERIIEKYDTKLRWENDTKCSSLLAFNKNVKWDCNLFEKYVLYQNERRITHYCKNAIIPKEIIIKYQDFWSSTQYAVEHKFRFSDFGDYTDNTYHSLWKLLLDNNSITWDDDLLGACIERIPLNEIFLGWSRFTLSFDFIKKYWDLSKEEEYWRIGDYNTGCYTKKERRYFINEIYDCKITKGIDIEFLIENEFSWLGSRLHSNNCIKEFIISEYEKEFGE